MAEQVIETNAEESQVKQGFMSRARAAAQKSFDGMKQLDSKLGQSADDFGIVAGKRCKDGGVKAAGAAKVVSGKVSEQFDVVSGQAMYQAVQERLAKQDQYNDALANKLFEALQRIEALEAELGGGK